MSQGYFLERTSSAKSVLEKASDLCSDKENEDDVGSNSDDIEEDEPIDCRILSPNKSATHHHPRP